MNFWRPGESLMVQEMAITSPIPVFQGLIQCMPVCAFGYWYVSVHVSVVVYLSVYVYLCVCVDQRLLSTLLCACFCIHVYPA